MKGITPVVNNSDFYYQDYINGVSACPSGWNLSGTNIDPVIKSYDEWKNSTTTKFVDDDPDGEEAYEAYKVQTLNNKAFTTYLLVPNLLRGQENEYLYNEKVNLTIPPVEYSEIIRNSGIKIHQMGGYFDSSCAHQVIERNAWGGKIVLGPWNHGGTMSGSYNPNGIYPNSDFDVNADILRWFDYLLRDVDNGYDEAPPFYYYVIGSDLGTEWRYTDSFPLENQNSTTLYFSKEESNIITDALKLSGEQSNNGLLTDTMPATVTSEDYTVDTSITLPQGFSSMSLTSTSDFAGDVDSKGLTFTSSPYLKNTEIIGLPKLDLWVSCENSDDVDFVCYLEEVSPDGTSKYLSRGLIRASHRTTANSDFYKDTPGTVYHPSKTADVNACLAEGLNNPVHLEFTFDIISKVIKAGNSLRVSVTCANTSMYQHYMYYGVVDGKNVLKTTDLPEIKLYEGGDKASSLTIPTADSVKNVYNGIVTFVDGSYSGPATMYFFNNNRYLYANGKWHKYAVASGDADYTMNNGIMVFDAGFSFQQKGEIIANGIAQNIDKPAYSFKVGNSNKSFYAESLDALTVQDGVNYADPANDPKTNYINTKFYLDADALSWVIPGDGSVMATLNTPYTEGVSDTNDATFSSAKMFAMYSNQYIVGYPFADLVASSTAGGIISVVLEHVDTNGKVIEIAKGDATIAAGTDKANIHIDLKQVYENRSDDTTYVAYNLAGGSMRITLYGNNVTATLETGASGSTVTVPFVDNTENVINGKLTLDGTVYNATMYRFGHNTYVNYTNKTQNDSWISFPTSTPYSVGTDNAAVFTGLSKSVKFLVQGNLVRNGEAQKYTGNAKNTVPFPSFYYLDTVIIKPVSDVLYMPGYKILRGVVYTPTAAQAPAGGYPTVINIHGYNGQYSGLSTHLISLLAEGYAIAGIDLRNYPSNTSPDHYTDIKGNIRYLRANADKYGINPNALAVYGASLGGNSALMAAISGDNPDTEGAVGGNSGVSSRVQGAVVGYGWTDLINFGLDQRTDQDQDPASKLASMTSGGDGEYAPAAEVMDWYGAGKGLLMLRNFLSQYGKYINEDFNGSLTNSNGEAYEFSGGNYTFVVDDAYITKWFAVLGANAFASGGSTITKGTYTYTIDELLAAAERAYAASPVYHVNAASSNIMTYAGFGGGQNITNNQTTRTMKAYNDADATAFEAANTQASSSGYSYGSAEEVLASINEYLDIYLKNDLPDTKIALYATDSAKRKYNVVGNYVSSSSEIQPVIEEGGKAWVSYDVLNSLIGTDVPSAEESGKIKKINEKMYGELSNIAKVTGCTVKYFAAGQVGAYIPWYDALGNVLTEAQRANASYGIVTLTYTRGNLIKGTTISTAGKNTVTPSIATRDTSYYKAVDGWNNPGVLVNNTNPLAPKYYYNLPVADRWNPGTFIDTWRYSNTFPLEDTNNSKLYLDDLSSIIAGGSDNAGTLNPSTPDASGTASGTSLTFTSAANLSSSGLILELAGFASADLWVTGADSTTANLAVTIGLLSGTTTTPIVTKNVSAVMTGSPVNVKVDFPDAITKSFATNSYFYVTVSSDSNISVITGGNNASSITLPTAERNCNVYNGTVTFSDSTKYAGTMYLFSDAYYLYYNGTWTKTATNDYTVKYQTLGDGIVVSIANFVSDGFTFEPEATQYDGRAQDYQGGVARGSVAFPSYNRIKMATVPVQPLSDGLYLPTTKTLYINIYLPEEAADGSLPLIMNIHGYGGDISSNDTFLQERLADGYAVAGIDLRPYPPECTPDWYADVCGNVRFLRANANKYKLNPDKFALYGASLGGNSSLGAAVGAGSSIEGTVGGNIGVSSRVQAAIIGYGWSDLINFGLDQRTDNDVRTDLLSAMINGGDGETAPAASAVNWYGPGKGFLMLRNFIEQYKLYTGSGINGNTDDKTGKAYNFFNNAAGNLSYTFIVDDAYKSLWFPFSSTGGFGGGTTATTGTYTYTVEEILAAIDRAAKTSPITYVTPDDPVMALFGGFGGTQNITNNQSMRTFEALQNNGVISFYFGNTQGNYGRLAVIKSGLVEYLDNWLKGEVKGTKIVLKANSSEAVINYVGRNIYSFKTTPLLVENATAYIPLAYVAKIIGADVSGITASTPGVVTKNNNLYVTLNKDKKVQNLSGLNGTWYPDSETMVLTGSMSLAWNGVTVNNDPDGDTGGSTGSSAGTSAVAIVNGGTKDIGILKTTTDSSGKISTTVTVDTAKLENALVSATSGSTLTLPIAGNPDVAAVVIAGDAIKKMEGKDITIVVKTDFASYSLPASEIDIDGVSRQFGANVSPADIITKVEIAKASSQTATVVENAAKDGGFSIEVPPVEFKVTCEYNGKSVEVNSFKSYVERLIAVPGGADPAKISTAIVVNPDGTIRHVPTQIVQIDGKYYAKINSLTNSVYTLIYKPVKFADAENHWAKAAINDMGSRIIVNGYENGKYNPDNNITRAEFATIIVRALGLAPQSGKSNFNDVASADWYCGFINTATSYALINGYGDRAFGPNDTITREQAMTMLARAMKITELKVSLTSSDIASLLAAFSDGTSTSDYAKESIAACLKTGVVYGTEVNTIAPKNYVTRAEVAVMIIRLLQKSGLI